MSAVSAVVVANKIVLTDRLAKALARSDFSYTDALCADALCADALCADALVLLTLRNLSALIMAITLV